jgi:hypothetical protein
MQRGTDIHGESEFYLKTGEIRDHEYGGEGNFRPYVEALAPHLPPPTHDELIIEQRIDMDCWPGGPKWLGFIDIGFSAASPLQIKDIKSTSDFRYAKTPLELKDNIQLNSYGRWVYHTTPYRGEIELGHIYIKTGTKVPKKPKVKPVSVITDYDYVMDYWEREMVTVREMQCAAGAKSAHELPPTISACGMYGGCPFRGECGLTTKELFSVGTKKKGKEMGNSFLSNLKKKAAEGGGGALNDTPNGVLSPDAPSRTTEVSDDDGPEKETAAAKKKRLAAEKKAAKAAEKEAAAAEKKAAKEAAAAEKKAAKAAEKKAAKAAEKEPSSGAQKDGAKKEFTLYIDCMPTKDVGRNNVEPTLFEDWFSPLVMAMNEEVMESRKLPSYLLLPYSEEKAMVAIAVADAIGRLPSEMFVSSGTPGAKDALAGLIPHATKVVRATR